MNDEMAQWWLMFTQHPGTSLKEPNKLARMLVGSQNHDM
jgi:hypothetical protein